MEKAREEIKQAFDYLCAIPVTGDGVELMAAAKEQLRRADKALAALMAEKKPKEKTDG